MSTDTEATNTVRRLQLHCPAATASLQMAMREAFAPATATWPQEEEYQYDSDDSVLDLDEEYPGLAEWVVQWRAAHQGATCTPPWWPSDFGRSEQSHFNKLPDLRELLNQAEEAKACQRVPEQSVAPTPLPFASVRDLDHQCQQRHDQTLAKRQSSPLGGEQRKRAKTPPQPDPYDAPDVWRGREEQKEGRDHGCLRTRVDRQAELDRARSKSRKRSKSRRQSKSHRHSKSRRSKSRRHEGDRERDRHEPRRPGVWSSQWEREMPRQSLSKTTQKDMRDAGHSAFSNDLLKFRKLKDEVVKNAQSYIRRRATIIFRTLSPDHEAVKCLSAFGDQAQKFAAEVLTIIEWGTQHWKLQETFPVPVNPQMALNARVHTDYDPCSEGSCRSCPRAATSRISACVVRRCGPGWPSSSNIGRITWPPVYTGANSATSATWRPPLSGTSTHGFRTRRVSAGVTWPWMPRCGLTCGITLPWNTMRSGLSRRNRSALSTTWREIRKWCTGPAL